MNQGGRLKFGPHKYAALNLLLAKWLRHFAQPLQTYCYVTLGGTELYDVANLNWIDQQLVYSVLSYEQDSKKFELAKNTAADFKTKGINVQVVPDDIFQYRRQADIPHVFYLDLLGNCSLDPYRREFRVWFEDEVIQPGDLLLITSYLGRNAGWSRVLRPYDSEFRLLRVDSLEGKKRMYNSAHPMFVLNRALLDADLQHELSLRSLGSLKYRDSSVMGLYGIMCEEGSSNLGRMVSGVSYFNTLKRDWTNAPAR
jgi:hypothetical protein